MQARRELVLLQEQEEELTSLTAELAQLRDQGVERHIARVTAEDRLIARLDELDGWAQAVGERGHDVEDALSDGPTTVLSDTRLAQLDAPPAVRALRGRLLTAVEELREHLIALEKAATTMTADIAAVRADRAAARTKAEQHANELLRVQDSGVQQAAATFRRKVQRRQQLEDVPRRRAATTRVLTAAQTERTLLLADLTRRSQQRAVDHEQAARVLTQQAEDAATSAGVTGRVRALHGSVTDAPALRALLDDRLTGQRAKLLGALDARAAADQRAVLDGATATPLSGQELLRLCAEGPEEVRSALPSTTAAQAAMICTAIEKDAELPLLLEEVTSRDHVELQLKVADEWRALDQLSVGQQATAVLLALLAHQDGPLVLDQPEDDLDNEFIVSSIVPLLRSAKRAQQYILTSHIANIPVLGDADLVTVMQAGRGADGRSTITVADQGAIDDPGVQERIETILEGGRDAFRQRQRRYEVDGAAD